jgi:glutamate transport system permease protein
MIALVLGVLIAGFRVSPVPPLRLFGTAWVTLLRNTPLTLLFLVATFVVPEILFPGLSPFLLAALALGFYTSSFICEAVRSGINTVPLGQAEAARSIGLTFTQTLRLVVLPQAYRSVIAPLGSVLIAMIKNTSVALVAGSLEAAAQMKQMFDDFGGTIPIFLGFAIGYMVLTLPTGYFFGWLAKRLAVVR